MQFYRAVYEWKGKAAGWALSLGEHVSYQPLEGFGDEPKGWVPCVPSSSGKTTAGCSSAGGFYGTPYLWEVWWQFIPATWGGGSGSWSQRYSGGNWL